jgi:hypothetical protein
MAKDPPKTHPQLPHLLLSQFWERGLCLAQPAAMLRLRLACLVTKNATKKHLKNVPGSVGCLFISGRMMADPEILQLTSEYFDSEPEAINAIIARIRTSEAANNPVMISMSWKVPQPASQGTREVAARVAECIGKATYYRFK